MHENPHWEWVDDGDGYNQRQEFNIKTLLQAQIDKIRKDNGL